MQGSVLSIRGHWGKCVLDSLIVFQGKIYVLKRGCFYKVLQQPSYEEKPGQWPSGNLSLWFRTYIIIWQLVFLSSGFPFSDGATFKDCNLYSVNIACKKNYCWTIKIRPKLYLEGHSECRPPSRAIVFYDMRICKRGLYSKHVLVQYKVRKVYCRQDVCKSIISCMI